MLAEQPKIAAPANPIALPEPAKGAIRFDHVEFRYPTRPDAPALHDFSLEVTPGDTLAVVGPSGAGKSTLFQLIQRFYDPQAGGITIDGVPLPHADPAAIRRRIAMVPQETVICGATARDNVRYGEWSASDDAIWSAAEAANAAEFLRKLPNGLDTFMGEGGARLSGGQRQRLGPPGRRFDEGAGGDQRAHGHHDDCGADHSGPPLFWTPLAPPLVHHMAAPVTAPHSPAVTRPSSSARAAHSTTMTASTRRGRLSCCNTSIIGNLRPRRGRCRAG